MEKATDNGSESTSKEWRNSKWPKVMLRNRIIKMLWKKTFWKFCWGKLPLRPHQPHSSSLLSQSTAAVIIPRMQIVYWLRTNVRMRMMPPPVTLKGATDVNTWTMCSFMNQMISKLNSCLNVCFCSMYNTIHRGCILLGHPKRVPDVTGRTTKVHLYRDYKRWVSDKSNSVIVVNFVEFSEKIFEGIQMIKWKTISFHSSF